MKQSHIDFEDELFNTPTESTKLPNVWYHRISNNLFCRTANGFKKIRGSKKALIKRNLL